MTFIRGSFRTRAEVEKELVRTLNPTRKNLIKTASLEHRRTRYQNHFHSASLRIAEANELESPNCNESVRSFAVFHKTSQPYWNLASTYPELFASIPRSTRKFDWLIFGGGREKIISLPKYLFTAKKKSQQTSMNPEAKLSKTQKKLTTWKTWPWREDPGNEVEELFGNT